MAGRKKNGKRKDSSKAPKYTTPTVESENDEKPSKAKKNGGGGNDGEHWRAKKDKGKRDDEEPPKAPQKKEKSSKAEKTNVPTTEDTEVWQAPPGGGSTVFDVDMGDVGDDINDDPDDSSEDGSDDGSDDNSDDNYDDDSDDSSDDGEDSGGRGGKRGGGRGGKRGGGRGGKDKRRDKLHLEEDDDLTRQMADLNFGRATTVERERYPIERQEDRKPSGKRWDYIELVKDPELSTRQSTVARIVGITPQGRIWVALPSLNKDNPDVERCYQIKGADYSEEKAEYIANGGNQFIPGNWRNLTGCKLEHFHVNCVAFDEQGRTGALLGRPEWSQTLSYWSRTVLSKRFGKKDTDALFKLMMLKCGQKPIVRDERTVDDIVESLSRIKLEED